MIGVYAVRTSVPGSAARYAVTVWGPAATDRFLEVVTSVPVAAGPTTTMPWPLGVPEMSIASVPVALLIGQAPPPVAPVAPVPPWPPVAARAPAPAAAATDRRRQKADADADPAEVTTHVPIRHASYLDRDG